MNEQEKTLPQPQQQDSAQPQDSQAREADGRHRPARGWEGYDLTTLTLFFDH
jgi:hypothetical protein